MLQGCHFISATDQAHTVPDSLSNGIQAYYFSLSTHDSLRREIYYRIHHFGTFVKFHIYQAGLGNYEILILSQAEPP